MPRPGYVLEVDRSTPPTLFWRGEGSDRAWPVFQQMTEGRQGDVAGGDEDDSHERKTERTGSGSGGYHEHDEWNKQRDIRQHAQAIHRKTGPRAIEDVEQGGTR